MVNTEWILDIFRVPLLLLKWSCLCNVYKGCMNLFIMWAFYNMNIFIMCLSDSKIRNIIIIERLMLDYQTILKMQECSASCKLSIYMHKDFSGITKWWCITDISQCSMGCCSRLKVLSGYTWQYGCIIN